MIAAFAWPPLGSAFRSVIPLSSTGERFVSTMTRAPGLTSGGGDALSAIQGLLLVFVIYYLLLMKRRASFFTLLLHGVAFSLLTISIILSARTGIVIVIVGALAIICRYILDIAKMPTLKFSLPYRIYMLIIMTAAGLYLVYLSINSGEYMDIIDRAIEPITNYIYYGEISTRSTDALFERMFFMPDSLMQTLFGDGNFGRNELFPYISSDSGYVRFIHGGGIVGLALIFIFYIFIIISSLSRTKHDKHVAFLTALTAAMILIINIKILYIGGYREIFIMMSLLFAISSASAMRRRRIVGGRESAVANDQASGQANGVTGSGAHAFDRADKPVRRSNHKADLSK